MTHLSAEARIRAYRRARQPIHPAHFIEMLGVLALIVGVPVLFFALVG